MSHNNSYADTTITASDGTSYKYGTVFTEKTTKGEGIACSSYANCYIGCSCNTSNGWYSTCQGSDCKSATDNHYTGVNSLSAGKSISDVASISASAAATSGLKTAPAAGNYTATAASVGLKTASAAAAATGATSGISTMASGATTCYKKKTCEEGGYYASIPADMECTPFTYNDKTCYKDCKKIEYFTIDGKICDADSSQCHSGSITTDQVDNNTMAVFNPTLPYRIKKGETLSDLEAMIPNGIKWEFSHWELQSGSGSFGSTTSALTTFTPNSDVYIIAYVKEAYNCSNNASDLQARINKFNSMIKYAFCDAGCSIPKEHTCNCGSDRERLLKDVDTHNSRCPDNKVGNPGLCPQVGLCKPGGPGACYSCLK